MGANAELVLDALGNTTRRQILSILEPGPRTVGSIASELPISRPAVSKHLRLLEQAHLVQSVQTGRRTVVSLDATGFEAARAWLDGFWDDALARFKLVAENTEPS